jgi:hypothetical protein
MKDLPDGDGEKEEYDSAEENCEAAAAVHFPRAQRTPTASTPPAPRRGWTPHPHEHEVAAGAERRRLLQQPR